MRSVLLCVALALNAFCAGGMFTFPLMAPALAVYNKMSPPQLTTIILAGMMSQYPVAVVVGSLIDRHGPALCTFIGGTLFLTGFGGLSLEVNRTTGYNEPLQTTFYRLVFSFLLIGLGTVFSYCSSLFAASKYFSNYIGLASGATMALFALSPLFFSVIATTFFMAESSGMLNVVPFSAFLALSTCLVAIFSSSIFTRYPIPVFSEEAIAPASVTENSAGETTPLLSIDPEHGLSTTSQKPRYPNTLSELAKSIDFWLLAIFCVLILGASEMVISNIGTISASLPPALYELPSARSPSSSAALQVKLLSIANTASRIVVGPLADLISPTATFLPSGIRTFPRKHIISRFSFLSSAALLLSFTFLWMDFGVDNQAQLWVLSIGTGLSYSATFTVLPSLISSLWGLNHLGRNFGFMMYAPFTGTPIFSYLYASISALHMEKGDAICKGRSCWQTTFSLSSVASVLALFISFVLWKRWKNKV